MTATVCTQESSFPLPLKMTPSPEPGFAFLGHSASHRKNNLCFPLFCPASSRRKDLLAGGQCFNAALPNSRLSPACCRYACRREQLLQDEPGSAPASQGRASLGRQTHTRRGLFGLVPSPDLEQVDKRCSGLLPKHQSTSTILSHGEPRH